MNDKHESEIAVQQAWPPQARFSLHPDHVPLAHTAMVCMTVLAVVLVWRRVRLRDVFDPVVWRTTVQRARDSVFAALSELPVIGGLWRVTKAVAFILGGIVAVLIVALGFTVLKDAKRSRER